MDIVAIGCLSGAKISGRSREAPVFQTFLMRSAASVIVAALGGFGVFCVIYSFYTPYLAAQGLILLSGALAVIYFTDR